VETVSADATPVNVGATGAPHVSPPPPDFLTWPRFKWACGTLVSLAVTGLFLCAVLLPLVALLAAGMWAAVTFVYEIPGVADRFRAGDFPAVIRGLSALDLAGRTGFFSASYFLLLLALVVFFVGLLGRRRQHFYLIPGVFLAVLGVGGFIVAAQFLFASLHVAPLASAASRRLIVSYVAINAVMLAALLADLRPSRRARRRRARARERPLRMAHGAPGQESTPIGLGSPAVATIEPSGSEPEPEGIPSESSTAPASESDVVDEVADQAAAGVPSAEHAAASADETPAIVQAS
jgi:hypothetical protein